jgi:hypothetical protein
MYKTSNSKMGHIEKRNLPISTFIQNAGENTAWQTSRI